MQRVPVLQIDQFHKPIASGRLYANNLRNHLKAHDFITKPHKHNFYLLVLFTAGSGVHEIDFQRFDVKPGSLFILKPGQLHNWKLSPDIDGYIFFHTKDYYNLTFNDHNLEDYPFFRNTQSSPEILLKGEEGIALQRLFEELLKEYKSEHLMKYRKICTLLDLFYIELTRFHNTGNTKLTPNDIYRDKFLAFESLLEDRYLELKTPQAYADLLNISSRHLNRICQSTLGKTASDVIFDRVLLEARRLLVHGSKSIAEVSLQLGYEDASYFSRIFKKRSGETPTEFLKKYSHSNK